MSSSWRYASFNETAKLISSLWAGHTHYSSANAPGAKWLGDTLGFNFHSLAGPGGSSYDYDISVFYYGVNGECSNDHTRSCIENFQWAEVVTKQIINNVVVYDPSEGPAGAFGGPTGFHSGDLQAYADEPKSTGPGRPEIASLLVRGGSTISPVPVPAAIWLFGTGIIGLIGFSKRRKAA